MQSEQADPCPENPGQGDMKHLQHTVMGLFSDPVYRIHVHTVVN